MFFFLVVICQQIAHSALIGVADVRQQAGSQKRRMNVRKNARLTPHSRAVLVRRVLEGRAGAEGCGRNLRRLPEDRRKMGRTLPHRRYRWTALRDRFFRPHKQHHPTPEYVIRRTKALWHPRWAGQWAATEPGISPSTVSRIFHCLGLSRIKDIVPSRRHAAASAASPARGSTSASEASALQGPRHRIIGRRTGMHRSGGAGWEYLRICIDDYSRVAFSAVMPDETARSAVAFLQVAVACYQNFGITIERVMTDNEPCYTSTVFRNLCTDLDIRHTRTRPYTP